MKKNQQPQQEKLVSMFFSWNNERKNLLLGLVCLFMGFIAAWCMYYLDLGNAFFIAVLLLGCTFGFTEYAKFLLTPSSLKKYITAWEQFAKEKLQDKEDAEARLKILKSLALTAEDKDDALRPFKKAMEADEVLIKSINTLLPASEEEFKTFREVMHGKLLITRIFSMLMSYVYWFARLPMDITSMK